MFDREINTINKFLKQQLWMDFEMCNMSRGKLELYGFLDEAEKEKIKIVFEKPHTVACNFFFTYEGKGDFISIADDKEAFPINTMYRVTQGNVIFKIANTNIETNMLIIAKGIEFQIYES